MGARARRGILVAVLLLGGTVGCDSTSEQIFPPNGSVILQVRDSGLVFQGAQPPGFQVVQWTLTAATVEVEGEAEPFDFLRRNPCVFTDNVLLSDDFVRVCGDGVVLPPSDGPVNMTIRLTLTAVEARRATQPDLLANEDFDGDGYLNRYDNCPMVANADQADENADGIGDVCVLVFQEVSYPDTDVDGVPDITDNCARFPNPPASPDPDNPFIPGVDSRGGADLIGDDCEAFVRPEFPDRPQNLQLVWTVSGLIADGARTILLVDFNNRRSIRCNATLTSCKIVSSGITVSVL